MKKKLVQISNACGIVSDENGDISFIEKESDSYNFEEILLKENNLEELKSKLEDCKNKLSLNKQNIIGGNVGSIILITMEIALFTFLHSALPLGILIAVGTLSYIPFKGMLLLMCGTRIGRYKEKNKLIADIEKLESELPELEKELTEIKEKSKYKVRASTVNETKPSVEEIYPEISLSMDSYAPEKHDTIKVLSLRKKK